LADLFEIIEWLWDVVASIGSRSLQWMQSHRGRRASARLAINLKKIINLPKWQHRWEKPSYLKDIERNKVVQPKQKRNSAKMATQSLLKFDKLLMT